MSKLFNSIISALAIGACAGCDINIHVGQGPSIKGSGNVVTESREVSPFSALDLKGSMDVEVTRGDAFKCTLRGDDNILPLITTEISGQRLCVSAKQNYSTRQRLVVLLEAPELTDVLLSGSGNISLADVTRDTFALKISGSGNVVGKGTTKQMTVEVNGSGNLKLGELAADRVEVTLNGSGNAEISAKLSLTAKVNGSGNITYSGNPEKVQTDVSGSGHISKN